MTNLLSEAASAMARAGHKKRTPEQRSAKAAKAASARWKGNGLTRDQGRVLRKLASKELVTAKVGDGVSGRRFDAAAYQLHDAGIIVVIGVHVGELIYRRGPGWKPDLVK